MIFGLNQEPKDNTPGTLGIGELPMKQEIKDEIKEEDVNWSYAVNVKGERKANSEVFSFSSFQLALWQCGTPLSRRGHGQRRHR